MKKIRHFMLALIIFLAILVCADKLVGFFLDKTFFSVQDKLCYALNDCDDDIVIIGASCAQVNYDPRIISDSTQLSVFNFGTGGQNIYYHYAILNTILQHHSPKVVILEIGGIDYLITIQRYNKERLPSALGPLYFHCDTVASIINNISPFEKYKYLSSVFPYNSTIDDIIYSAVKGGNNINIKNKGYGPITGSSPALFLKEEEIEGVGFDDAKIEYILRLVEVCKSRNIEIIIVRSPAYHTKTTNYSNLVYDRLYKNTGIEIWDYEQDSTFLTHKEYFKDALHLNHNGATIYSQIIAGRLKEELSQLESINPEH
jgi:lysophospholipase L1-like esterase